MAEKESASKGITLDWIVRGVLTKVGDIFDRLTGRGWRPSSSLATSELVEKLKSLMDAEARDEPPGAKFVPNNIKLKMQWDKFSTDSEKGLAKLETELLAAAVDHINDKRYFTHAPLAIEVKPDYFTSGVRLQVSFDKFEDEDREASVHLSVPGAKSENTDDIIPPHRSERTFLAACQINGEEFVKTLNIKKGVRLSVGRTKENDLVLNDASVSKIHASLTVDDDGSLVVADTGSTNGTFVKDQRIAYGKAVIVGTAGEVRFGTVNVMFKPEHIPMPADDLLNTGSPEPSLVTVLDEPANGPDRSGSDRDDDKLPQPTQLSVPVPDVAPTQPALDISTIDNDPGDTQ